MAGAQSTIISKGMRYRKGLVNPLESVSNFDYCHHCKDEVDTEIDEGDWENIFVYRKRCLRCGKVIQWGVADRELKTADPATMEAVRKWILATGQNRT